jgi:hypothetical protein
MASSGSPAGRCHHRQHARHRYRRLGFSTASQPRFVRPLTDNGLLDGQSGATVGADIDAVGASSTRAADPGVPEIFATWLDTLPLGFRPHWYRAPLPALRDMAAA